MDCRGIASMGLGEGAGKGRSAVPARPEAHQLIRIVRIGLLFVIGSLELADIDQNVRRRRFAHGA